MSRKIIFVLLFFIQTILFSEDLEIKEIFDKNNIEGTIVLESFNTQKVYIHNKKRANELLLPASTFKILNTLIALNEKIVNENSLIKWDGKDRGWDVWNKDQSLKSAFQKSCVWCYQVFAKEIGLKKYSNYLNKLDYGNKLVGSEVTKFWLSGDIRITAIQQIEFLKKVYLNKIPFKLEDINILKEIMINEKTKNYTLWAKTGWSTSSKPNHGWFVGYIESKNDTWFFATNLITKDKSDLKLRKKLTLDILKLKNII